MADLTTLQSWLTEAESAYHQLQTGKQFVSGTKDGRSFQYTQASAGKLKSYITELKNQIAGIQGQAKRGPIYPALL